LDDAGPTRAELNEWSRVTSLTVHDGKLFAGTGSCTSSIHDAPRDVRGRVFCLEAGRCASYGGDVGSGWHHIAAVRQGERLCVYVDGRLSAQSATFAPDQYDLSTNQPLRLGIGQTDYFQGRMRDVRLYSQALDASAVHALAASGRPSREAPATRFSRESTPGG
jgi:hypothetical protein